MEGALAKFNLVSDIPVQTDLLIPLEVVAEPTLYFGDTLTYVRLQTGQNSVHFTIQTINDDQPEDNEQIQVFIKDGFGYDVIPSSNRALVSINDFEDHVRVRDRISEAYSEVVPFMLASIGTRSLETVLTRSNLAVTNFGNTQFELNGRSEIPDIIQQIGTVTNQDSQMLKDMLRNSSFSIGLQPDTTITNNATIWGVNDTGEISSSKIQNSKNWSGELSTNQVGIETLLSQNILAGLTASISSAQIGYGVDEEIELHSDNSAVQTYFGYVPLSESSQFQVATGYGKFATEIMHESQIGETLSEDYMTFAVAGRKNLINFGNTDGIGSFKLAMTGQYWNAQIVKSSGDAISASADTNRYELLLAPEGTYQVTLPSGAKVSNVTLIGLGTNNEVAVLNQVLDLSNKVQYSHPVGFSTSLTGQMQRSVGNQVADLSFVNTLHLDFGFDSLGPQIEIQSQVDRSNGTSFIPKTSLHEISSNGLSNPKIDGTSINSKIGYGFKFGDSNLNLVPYGQVEYSGYETSKFRIGNNVELGPVANFNVEGGFNSKHSGKISTEFKFSGNLNW